MLRLISPIARRIDLWLHKHLGRPYGLLLAIGLVLSIIASGKALWDVWEAGERGLAAHAVSTVATVVLQVGLLINQLAQIDRERAKSRRRRNLKRDKARVAAEGAAR